MALINLRKYYPYIYNADFILDLPLEIVAELEKLKREESNYYLRRRRYKAFYDLIPELEKNKAFQISSAEDTYFEELEQTALEAAERRLLYSIILTMPEKKIKRMVGYYLLGLSNVQLAELENITEGAVRKSTKKVLKKYKKICD